jgi:hypothetical protein
MNVTKATPQFRKTFRVNTLLKALGLPRGSRWNEASQRLKSFLVEARRTGDTEQAVMLSQVKVFLFRNLPRVCGCGAVIAAGNRNCRICAPNPKSST